MTFLPAHLFRCGSIAAALVLCGTGCSTPEPTSAPEPSATPGAVAASIKQALSQVTLGKEKLITGTFDPGGADTEAAASVQPHACHQLLAPEIKPGGDDEDHHIVAATENADYSVTLIRSDMQSLKQDLHKISESFDACRTFTLKVEKSEKKLKLTDPAAADDTAEWTISARSKPVTGYAVSITDYGAVIASTNHQVSGKQKKLTPASEVAQLVAAALKKAHAPRL